jgi:hypothetical protein
VFFAEAVEQSSSEIGTDVRHWLNATSWALMKIGERFVVRFDEWATGGTWRSPDSWSWICASGDSWFLGTDVHDFSQQVLSESTDAGSYLPQAEQARRRIASLWALAATPRLIETSSGVSDRAALRRAARADVPSEMTVIDLRRPAEAGAASGNRTVEWTHRWIVNGHWRQQPYGPGGELRRPTWIAPFIKGPSDKPLELKQRVGVIRSDPQGSSTTEVEDKDG